MKLNTAHCVKQQSINETTWKQENFKCPINSYYVTSYQPQRLKQSGTFHIEEYNFLTLDRVIPYQNSILVLKSRFSFKFPVYACLQLEKRTTEPRLMEI